MCGKARIFTFVVTLALAGTVWADQPCFQGKPADWWADALKFRPDGLESQKAMVSLARGGPDAVPVLVYILSQNQSNGVVQVANTLLTGIAIHERSSATALVEHLVPIALSDEERAFAAEEILKTLLVADPVARSSLRGELTCMLQQEAETGRRSKALDMLAAIAKDSPDDVRVLVEVLLSGAANTRVSVTLRRMGKEVLPSFAELLPSAPEKALWDAENVLTRLNVPAHDLIVGLLPAIREPDAACTSMVSMILIERADDKGVGFELRRKLFGCLDAQHQLILIPKLEKDACEAPGFAQFVSDVISRESLTDKVRVGILAFVPRIGAESAEILVPQLAAGLTNSNPLVRLASANGLGAIGSAAMPAVHALEEAAKKETDAAAREGIVRALSLIRSR